MNRVVETTSVASQAAVGGPSPTLALATSRGWHELALPGVVVGLLGYGIGNYAGLRWCRCCGRCWAVGLQIQPKVLTLIESHDQSRSPDRLDSTGTQLLNFHRMREKSPVGIENAA